jgi:adenylosuccinate synthase
VALNIPTFLRELDELASRDVPTPKIAISDRAQVLLKTHILLDGYEEERLGGGAFGSTKQGIAPFYADKYRKVGVQVADLYDEGRLRERLGALLAATNALLEHHYGKPSVREDDLLPELLANAKKIRPFVRDTALMLREGLDRGERILLEGQLGALRDPDHGIYPFSTSSSPLAGFAAVGAGIPPYAITRIIAVAKAYSSCVGAGPFVSELHGDEAEDLRKRGGDKGEYGATTGRPRRVGWFDAVATRYGCRVQGATEMALSLLDVLSYRDEIPLCAAYEIDGERTSAFPTSQKLERAKPVWETLPGWRTDITAARRYEDLSANARRYVERIEELVGVKAKWISVAPGREAIIRREG